MKNTIKIAIVGLGQVGNYLYNELKIKQKDIELKTGKKIKIVGISAKSKNKKRKFKIDKKIFYSNPIKIITEVKPDVLFEVIGLPDGISKRVVELALKNKIHVITPNKALIANDIFTNYNLYIDNYINFDQCFVNSINNITINSYSKFKDKIIIYENESNEISKNINLNLMH